MKKKRFLVHKK